MVEYLALSIILIILIIDLPFFHFKFKDKRKLIFFLKISLIFLVSVHLLITWNLQDKNISSTISGITLLGLVLIYSSSTDHKGIEDKLARKVFKRLAWYLIWIIALIHII